MAVNTEYERGCWLALARVYPIRQRLGRWIPKIFPDASSLWEADSAALRGLFGLTGEEVGAIEEARSRMSPEAALEELKSLGAWCILRSDPEYPPMLRTLEDDAPPLLYVKGPVGAAEDGRQQAAAAIFRRPAVAVVGSRSASAYGEHVAGDFGYGLAATGVTVVSGLALGVDAAAHWGAVDCGGATVAVIGCGIDVVYPRANRSLFARIPEAGLIITEYGPGTKPLQHHFPARNRIISALSKAVVVIEGGHDSGAMITARLAAEQGRAVLAVPGSVYSPVSKGPHCLIRDGAVLATSVEQILEEAAILPGPSSAKSPRSPSESETSAPEAALPALPGDKTDRSLLESISWTPMHSDAMIASSGLTAAEVAAGLIRLELGGFIVREYGGLYFRLK